jgi:hypothetical protein
MGDLGSGQYNKESDWHEQFSMPPVTKQHLGSNISKNYLTGFTPMNNGNKPIVKDPNAMAPNPYRMPDNTIDWFGRKNLNPQFVRMISSTKPLY